MPACGETGNSPNSHFPLCKITPMAGLITNKSVGKIKNYDE